MGALTRASLALLLVAGTAHAAPPGAPSTALTLREANRYAIAGDWERVAVLVDPRDPRWRAPAELAEAHRLAGLAAFFLQRLPQADAELVAYLRLDPDAHLDPALYPPEVVTFFENVRASHAAELRSRRPRAKRYPLLTLIPPLGQVQNGEHTKAWVTAGVIVGLAAANVSTYLVLRSWCHDTGSVCDADGTDHRHAAIDLRVVNIATGIGFIAAYAWGIYDSVAGYRRRTRATDLELAPYAAPTTNGAMFGVGGRF